MVEHLLAKEKVTSSNLVFRSFLILVMATWPSGKAEVCKTFIAGSNPAVASFGWQPIDRVASFSLLFEV